jgi:hypothetical protein
MVTHGTSRSHPPSTLQQRRFELPGRRSVTAPLSTVPGRDLAHALATWLAPAVTQAPENVDLTDAPGNGL